MSASLKVQTLLRTSSGGSLEWLIWRPCSLNETPASDLDVFCALEDLAIKPACWRVSLRPFSCVYLTSTGAIETAAQAQAKWRGFYNLAPLHFFEALEVQSEFEQAL